MVIAKKIISLLFLFTFFTSNAFSQDIYFLDFSYVMNQSKAGKEAQTFLNNKVLKENKKLQDLEKKLLEEEKLLISKKAILKNDDYKKKVDELRKKVIALREKRGNFSKTINKQRAEARTQILKNLNPILTDYMKEKNIKIVLDKRNILIGVIELDLTKLMVDQLNTKLKSLNLK